MSVRQKIFLGVFFGLFIVVGLGLVCRGLIVGLGHGFGKTEIVVLISGIAFTLVGSGFMYFGLLRKQTMFDLAAEYEDTMVSPEDTTDANAHAEAVADELSKLSKNSMTRMTGELDVWRQRLTARWRTFTVGEHLICFGLLILPMVILNVCQWYFGRRLSTGQIHSNVIVGFVIGLLLLGFLKMLYLGRWKWLAKRGKFTESCHAIVVSSAFESAHVLQMGSLARTYTLSKKFRVVATIDGVRSLGYVKGHIPPAPGAELHVLIRPGHPKQWIIDTTKQN